MGSSADACDVPSAQMSSSSNASCNGDSSGDPSYDSAEIPNSDTLGPETKIRKIGTTREETGTEEQDSTEDGQFIVAGGDLGTGTEEEEGTREGEDDGAEEEAWPQAPREQEPGSGSAPEQHPSPEAETQEEVQAHVNVPQSLEKRTELFKQRAQDAEDSHQLFVDLSFLGIGDDADTWLGFFNHLRDLADDDMTMKKHMFLLPLSFPVFNVQANRPDDASGQLAGKTQSNGTSSAFTRSLVRCYFHDLGELDDSARTREFDQNFGKEWGAPTADDISKVFRRNFMPSDNCFYLDSNSPEKEIDTWFHNFVLCPMVNFTERIEPTISARQGFNEGLSAEPPAAPVGPRRTPDWCIVKKNSEGKYVVLSVCEGKRVPIDQLPGCLEWDFHNKFGTRLAHPIMPRPKSPEIKKCRRTMEQGMGYCFSGIKDEIVFYDGLRMQVIKFDLKHAKRYETLNEARGDVRNMFPGIEMDEEESAGGEEESDTDDWPVCVIGYWRKTINWYDTNPTMRKQMAMMVREELKVWRDDKERYNRRRGSLFQFAKKILEDPELLLENLRTEHRDVEARMESSAEDNEFSGPSSEAHEVDHLSMDVIQDWGHVHKVIRMSTEECRNVFPNVKGSYKSVVVKVLDFANIELYHDTEDSAMYGDMDLAELRCHCVNGFVNEVECYHRITLYNRTHPTEPPIHVPDMLDYGTCCIRDSQMNSIEGFYLVLEDLKDESRTPTLHSELSYDLKRLKSIGITHRDLAARNQFNKGGQIYLFDFNIVEIKRPWKNKPGMGLRIRDTNLDITTGDTALSIG